MPLKLFENKHVELIYNSIVASFEQNVISDDNIQINCDKFFNETCYETLMALTINFGEHFKSKYDGHSLKELSTRNPALFDIVMKKPRKIIQRSFESYYRKPKDLDTFKKQLEYLIENLPCAQTFCPECQEYFCVYLHEEEMSFLSNDKSETHHKCLVGNEDITIESNMHFESGKIIIANNLCMIFDKKTIDNSDQYIKLKTGLNSGINSHKGKQLHHEYWNKLGLIYICTGNSYPCVYSDSNGNVKIMNYTDDKNYQGRIDTKIWAVCAMDYNTFTKQCEKNNINIESFIHKNECIIIDAQKDSTYEIKDYTYIDDNIFATFTINTQM